MDLLRGHWSDASVTTDFANRYDDFDWVIDNHFDTAWIHTGWFDSTSENPQVSVTFDSTDPGTPTGFDATTGEGGKSALLDNTAYIDTWVHNDRDLTGGINPKKYAWQLRLRAELIVLDNAPHGDHPWDSLGTGQIRSPEEPEETPIGSRWRIPVLFSDMKKT
ncbi:hypothetical protein [Natrialba taiwanensis]|nr:hypothetical protein [Natrialba taiwanensis]